MTAPGMGVPTPREVVEAQRRTDGSWTGEQLEDLVVMADRAQRAGVSEQGVALAVGAALDGAAAPPGPVASSEDSPRLRSVRQWILRGEAALDDAEPAARQGHGALAWGHHVEAALCGVFAGARALGTAASGVHRLADALERLAAVWEADRGGDDR